MKKKCEMRGFPFRNRLTKLVLMMKFTVFFLLFFAIQLSASVYSQQTRLKVNFNQATIKEVIAEIEKQTDLTFFYSDDVLNLNEVVTLRSKSMSVEDILILVSEQTGLSLTVVRDQIMVKNPNLFNRSFLQEQQLDVSGEVTDSSGAPLPGVSIVIKGTTTGTITDFDGKFNLDNVSGNAILVFSFVGMKTQEIEVAGQTSFNVFMEDDAIGIEEVVAIGYGTKSKSTLTGAVELVKEEQLESRPAARATELLQGLAAGVQVTRGNSGRIAAPENNIYIRGLSSRNNPGVLVVIDGIVQKETNSYALDNVNPNDIASISILKDAQAAIYGSRASGGVILITTKKGMTDKPKIDLSVNYNIQKPALWTKLTDILQNVEMHDEAFTNDGHNTNMFSHIVDYIAENKLTHDLIAKNTGEYVVRWPFDNSANIIFGYHDWPDIMYDPAPMQTYNAAISGKTKRVNYYNSINYIDQKSMLAYGTNTNKQLTVKLKNDIKITDYLETKTNFTFQNQQVEEPTSYTTAQAWQGLLWPVLMPYNKFGNYYNFGSNQNPIGHAVDAGDATTLNYRVNTQIGFVLTPIKDLSITAEFSNNIDISQRDWASLGFDMYDEENKYSYNSNNNRNSAGTRDYRSRYTVANFFANYSFTPITDHKFGVMAGYSHEENDVRLVTAQRNLGLISPELPQMAVGDSEEQYNGQSKYHSTLRSAFARVDYDYKNKVLLEGTFRYDGSSKFAAGKKWSPFWGVSGAWVVSNEGFMDNLKGAVDFLKVRLSWGQLGNQAGGIGLYDYISQINIGGSYPLGNPLSPGQKQSAWLGAMTSETRSWEKIETTNLGIEYATLNSRLSVSADVYVKENKDMFFNKEFPQVLGTTPPSINGAHFRTKGWELTLGWKDKVRDFNYFVNLNISDNTNKVVELAEPAFPSLGTNFFIEGETVNAIYGFQYDGIIQNETELNDYKSQVTSGVPGNLRVGDARYKDLDGDGKLEALAYEINDDGTPTENSGDLINLGDAGQHYLFGINMGANWKNFDVSAFFQGVLKWTVSEPNGFWLQPFISYFYNDTWSPERTGATYPRLSQNWGLMVHNGQLSNAPYKLFDSRYIRLKNLQIGYTLPDRLANKIKCDKVRVYFSGTDLWESSNLPGNYDPEKPFQLQTTPMPRGYSFGINVTL